MKSRKQLVHNILISEVSKLFVPFQVLFRSHSSSAIGSCHRLFWSKRESNLSSSVNILLVTILTTKCTTTWPRCNTYAHQIVAVNVNCALFSILQFFPIFPVVVRSSPRTASRKAVSSTYFLKFSSQKLTKSSEKGWSHHRWPLCSTLESSYEYFFILVCNRLFCCSGFMSIYCSNVS